MSSGFSTEFKYFPKNNIVIPPLKGKTIGLYNRKIVRITYAGMIVLG